MLVDSSVWIDFFRNVPSRQVIALDKRIGEDEILIGDLILCEVLQGAGSASAFGRISRQFALAVPIIVSDQVVAAEAARNYRTLRSLGVTIRKTIDTLIATRCIVDDIPLLYSDRDFDPFVRHLGLRSALDDPGVN